MSDVSVMRRLGPPKVLTAEGGRWTVSIGEGDEQSRVGADIKALLELMQLPSGLAPPCQDSIDTLWDNEDV